MAVSQQGGGKKRNIGEPPQHSSVASGPAAIVGPSPVPDRVFPSDPEESRPVLRPLGKVFRFPGGLLFRVLHEKGGGPDRGAGLHPRAALTVDFLKARR